MFTAALGINIIRSTTLIFLLFRRERRIRKYHAENRIVRFVIA